MDIIWIFAILAAASTFLGGFFALKYRDRLHLILGFSAGTVLGVAIFDLIPQSFSLSGTENGPLVSLLMATGFISYMILERSFSIHHHPEEHCENPSHGGEIGATTLIAHSFIDGLVIGLSFKVSSAVGIVVSLAVLAHKFSDGINTVNALLTHNKGKNKIKGWVILATAAPVAGIVLSQFISLSKSALGLLLAFFAGLFIYLGASDLVPESHHRHPTLWTTAMTILGMLAIYFVVHFAG